MALTKEQIAFMLTAIYNRFGIPADEVVLKGQADPNQYFTTEMSHNRMVSQSKPPMCWHFYPNKETGELTISTQHPETGFSDKGYTYSRWGGGAIEKVWQIMNPHRRVGYSNNAAQAVAFFIQHYEGNIKGELWEAPDMEAHQAALLAKI